MKFQILHESRGRVRLRAMQRSMSMRDADLLEAWILALPGVDQVTVHERICGVTILFTGEQAALYSALSRFSYEEAEEEAPTRKPKKRRMYSAPTAARSIGSTRKSWSSRCCGTMGKSCSCPCRCGG